MSTGYCLIPHVTANIHVKPCVFINYNKICYLFLLFYELMLSHTQNPLLCLTFYIEIYKEKNWHTKPKILIFSEKKIVECCELSEQNPLITFWKIPHFLWPKLISRILIANFFLLKMKLLDQLFSTIIYLTIFLGSNLGSFTLKSSKRYFFK